MDEPTPTVLTQLQMEIVAWYPNFVVNKYFCGTNANTALN
jgi:hypothetical protein